jgi:TonB-linked SusC/RagA family outer membrane protein
MGKEIKLRKCLLLICMFFMTIPLFSQDIGRLRGMVRGEEGEPMAGVTVVATPVNQSNSAKTTVTGRDGVFLISDLAVDAAYNVEFSSIGYRKNAIADFKIKANDNNSLVVDMIKQANTLEDVVVTALNIKKDLRKTGYLVETLKGNDVSDIKSVNIQNSLAGKIPGVDVSNTANGAAGSKRIIIRGISSISGNNQPLWVVDGIPVNSAIIGDAVPSGGGGIDYGDGLTYINPDDIAEITVLKGNAAAALYGSRASTGVILVTTKSGNHLGKNTMEVAYNASYTVDEVRDFTNWQYEYGQGNNGKPPTSKENALSSISSWGGKLDGSSVVQFDGQMRPYIAQRNNMNNFYKNGSTFSNTLSLMGRNEHSNFRLSSSYLTNSDIVPNSGFKRMGLSFNSNTVYKRLSVNTSIGYSVENAKNRQRIGGNYSNVHYTMLYLPTNVNVLDLQPGYDSTMAEIGLNNQGIPTNPYFVINRIHQEDQRRRVNLAVEVKYDFTKWLYGKGRILEDYFNYAETDYTPSGVIWSPKGGGMSQTEIRNAEENYELIFGLNSRRIGKDFTVGAFAGGNIYNRLYKSSNINGTVFVLPNIYTINNLSVKYPSTGFSRSRINSLFFNTELAYRSLYVTLTGRKDWFSTLPLNNNSLFYPSASVSYVLNKALYPKWLSFAKVRGSVAQVSGGASPYSLNLSYRLDRDVYDGVSLQRIGVSTVPNANLVPLISTEYETGTDLGFLENKLMLNFTYYNRRTRQDIITTNISITSGYNNAILNVGEISNSGIETSLTYNIIRNDNLNWNVIGVFSFNRNKVTSMGSGITKIQLAESKTGSAFVNVEQGKPYGQIFGYRYKYGANNQITYDKNGFPLNSGELFNLGTGYYDKIASIRSGLSWKNWLFNFMIDSKFGAKIYSEINALAMGMGKNILSLEGRENGLTVNGIDKDGNPLEVQIPVTNVPSYYSRVASFTHNFVYDASFIKFRELSIGYRLPQNLLQRARIKSASLNLIGRNLFILYKKTPNIDPESNTVSGNAQGIAATVYPSVRNYGLSLNVTL